jgi:ankyrin repeat protein
VVKLLLDQEGIDINRQDNLGTTALSMTARYNWVESAKLLLEREDLNVNISDMEGKTALQRARCQEFFEIVDLLQFTGER